MATSIYTLSNPITDEVRYVGKTINPHQRLIEHCSKRKGIYRNNWIHSLRIKGLKPKMDVIDIVTESEWEFWEQYWIAQMKAWGFRLTNLSVGGNSNTGTRMPYEKKKERRAYKHTEDAKRRISENNARIWKGVKRSDEYKKRQALAITGRKATDETKLKMSIAQTGRKITWADKISKALKGKPLSDYQKQRIAESRNCEKTILQFDSNMVFIKEWESAVKAARALGMRKDAIYTAAKKEMKIGKKHNWQYKK